MIYSVNFHDMYHIIPMVMKAFIKKFFFTNLHYHLIPHVQIMDFAKKMKLLKESTHGHSICQENISTKIRPTFYYHSHHLIPITKRAVMGNAKMRNYF